MRLISYREPGDPTSTARIGINSNDGIIDANRSVRALLYAQGCGQRIDDISDAIVPPDMVDFLETGEYGWRILREAVDFVRQADPEKYPILPPMREQDDVVWLAPLPRARSLREFGQFEGHVSRYGAVTLPDVWYEYPFYWKGNPNNLLGHQATVPWPAYSHRLDFELEIAAVIGRRGRNLSPEEAIGHIAGFTIFNDITARDFQRIEMRYRNGFGKSKDFCNVLGPVLVTPDELDYQRFVVAVTVNGETWATANTANMYTPWNELVAYCSRDEWLEPGDVITSGTVDGCSGNEALGWPDDGPILRPGDVVDLTVDGIGTLRSVIGEPAHRST